jgi:hypothetical protein
VNHHVSIHEEQHIPRRRLRAQVSRPSRSSRLGQANYHRAQLRRNVTGFVLAAVIHHDDFVRLYRREATPQQMRTVVNRDDDRDFHRCVPRSQKKPSALAAYDKNNKAACR